LVHLSICVIQRGEETHLKKAEQQGHSTVVGKGFPRESRMVILTWVSLGPPPQGQHKHLPISAQGRRGAAGAGRGIGDMWGEACPQAWETYVT